MGIVENLDDGCQACSCLQTATLNNITFFDLLLVVLWIPWFAVELWSFPWWQIAQWWRRSTVAEHFRTSGHHDGTDVERRTQLFLGEPVDDTEGGVDHGDEDAVADPESGLIGMDELRQSVRRRTPPRYSLTNGRWHQRLLPVDDEGQAIARKALPEKLKVLEFLVWGPVLNIGLLCFIIFMTWGKILPWSESTLEFGTFVYMTCLACAISYRRSISFLHGANSPLAEELDKRYVGFFGVHIIERGNSGMWLYPVLAVFPAAVLLTIRIWFARTEFPVQCTNDVNGSTALVPERCQVMSNPWRPMAFASFALPSLFSMYHAVQSVVRMMIRLDPTATGTLSELEAFNVVTNVPSSGSDDDQVGSDSNGHPE